jgi:DNA-directed RNA polymerase I subunit RPA1
LQSHGFTCGLDDIALSSLYEIIRLRTYEKADKVVNKILKMSFSKKSTKKIKQSENSKEELDVEVLKSIYDLSAKILENCLPRGQLKPYPHNSMSVMTNSGGKGSKVNFSQLSCFLGQQELDGRRTPRTINGKSLPSFAKFDLGARSGGLICDRFLSGLHPQEYFFHSMAGRNGLLDTTVKTSRSGYLQRSLVKALETLKVHYDNTVRDSSTGALVQFLYGEDGLNVTSSGFLNHFDIISHNFQHRISKSRLSNKNSFIPQTRSNEIEIIQEVL